MISSTLPLDDLKSDGADCAQTHSQPEDGALAVGGPRVRHVFLSYRSLERAFALRLAALLHESGINVWADCLPSGLRVGDDWPRSLAEAIDSCRCVVAVISPAYLNSEMCRNELSRARQRGRIVFPVLIEPVSPNDWPIELQRLQYDDFTNWRDPDTLAKAANSLVSRLRTNAKDVIGQRPDAEQQYLLSLIADLESRVGVARHTTLAGRLRELADEPRTAQVGPAEWHLDPDFKLLTAGARVAGGGGEPRDVSFDDLAALPQQFVLTGAAGAGKTTTLLHFALRFARLRLRAPRTNPLPICLRLPDWPRGASPREFLASRWPLEIDVETAINSDAIVLLLDGLNEMGESGYVNAIALGEWLRSGDGPRRVILTCRSRDYQDLDLGISEARLQPMNDAQIRRFVKAYLRGNAESFLERMMPYGSRSNDPGSLRSLARNPYMLFALILLHQGEQELPRNMGKLFQRLCEFQWAKERLHRAIDWVPFDEVRRRLSKLAFEMTMGDYSTHIPNSLVREHLGERFAIRTAVGASIFEQGETGLRFFHQRILEYFAAAELVSRGMEALPAGAPAQWREVVIAAAGITTDPDAVVEFAGRRDTLLAAECLATGVNVATGLRLKIEQELADRLAVVGDKVVRKEVERSRPESLIEDRVGDYFASYESLDDLIRKVRAGERYVCD